MHFATQKKNSKPKKTIIETNDNLIIARCWQIITQPKDRWMMIEATIEWHNDGKDAI